VELCRTQYFRYRIACCGFIRAETGGRFTAVLRKYVFLCPRGVAVGGPSGVALRTV